MKTAQPTESTRKIRFIFARDFGERAAEINDLYNRFTGRNRTFQAYRWEWQQPPSGPALIWTITEAETSRIVGHHGIVPTPLVRGNAVLPAGRTENTIIEKEFRSKIFYPGMERKALEEALGSLRILYTVNAALPGPLRRRLGYALVGRWTVYLPRVGPAYLLGLLKRARDRLAPWCPDAALALAATVVGAIARLVAGMRRGVAAEVSEIEDVDAIGTEYDAFWRNARGRYDLTVDRTLEFLRWRFRDNPHLAYRTWTLRRQGKLTAIVIGHAHAQGRGGGLYVDDIIVGDYDDESFDQVVRALPQLAPELESIMVSTLAVDTPLHRALRRRFPLQAFALARLQDRLFGEMLALDKSTDDSGHWYVTAIFTEGMDTSRDAVD